MGAAKAYSESQMTMTILFLLAIVFIFAILSVQFENFIDPVIKVKAHINDHRRNDFLGNSIDPIARYRL